jgi:transcriptional regulator with XRE-family HTH domain
VIREASGVPVRLDEYLFKTKTTKTAFAERLGISRGYLQHILSGIKNPSVKLAKKIEEITGGKVSKEEILFPEDYREKE